MEHSIVRDLLSVLREPFREEPPGPRDDDMVGAFFEGRNTKRNELRIIMRDVRVGAKGDVYFDVVRVYV